MPRVMNTMRERRSVSGQSRERDRRMEDVMDAVDHDRRRFVAEIENAFDPQQILAARAA